MGRRNSFALVPKIGDARSSFGDYYLNEALQNINGIQQRAVAIMTSYQASREKTLSMLFHDTDIAKLQQVRGLIKTDTETKTYLIGEGKDGDINLSINYEGAMVPAIEPSAMRIYPERVQPLRDFTVAVMAEHKKYEEVKGVLRWLNRNATPGAIRYFFPQAMKLVPTAPMWKDLQEVPSRYSTPADYGVWAQVIRDAANTVAGMMLLPEDTRARERKLMWLTFKSVNVHLDLTDPSKTNYATDQTIYNF